MTITPEEIQRLRELHDTMIADSERMLDCAAPEVPTHLWEAAGRSRTRFLVEISTAFPKLLAALTETAEVERLKKALDQAINITDLWLDTNRLVRPPLSDGYYKRDECPELYAHLESLRSSPPTALPTESPNEEFERLAAEFRKATRLMAPGKDDPSGSATREERNAAWESWLKARPTALDAQEEK